MDMGSTTMSMAATATAASAAATSTEAMSMDMGGSCKISMLWNWTTVDACFISSTWHIKSTGMFAGSCIGVILLVMSLEFLRRSAKEYDRYLIRQHQRGLQPVIVSSIAIDPKRRNSENSGQVTTIAQPFRPNIFQQMIRATFHMFQFAVAYFIMLLAMYFNGYIIICIIIGAWLGSFVFHWESVDVGDTKEEATMCCG